MSVCLSVCLSVSLPVSLLCFVCLSYRLSLSFHLCICVVMRVSEIADVQRNMADEDDIPDAVEDKNRYNDILPSQFCLSSFSLAHSLTLTHFHSLYVTHSLYLTLTLSSPNNQFSCIHRCGDAGDSGPNWHRRHDQVSSYFTATARQAHGPESVLVKRHLTSLLISSHVSDISMLIGSTRFQARS